MSGRIGQLGAVGLALESTWGEPVEPTTYLEVSHANVRPIIAREIPTSVRGTRARRAVREGAMLCSGALTADVCAGAAGELLKAAFGTVTTTLVASSGSAAVYQHTFTRCDTTFLPSLTLEQNMGGLTSRRIAGLRVNQLSLALSPGRTLIADVDCRGREQALITPTGPSYSPDQALPYQGFTAEIGGQPSVEVEEFILRFRNGLVDNVWTAGNAGKLGQLPAGAFAVSGRMALSLESTDPEQVFVEGEATSLRLRLDGETLVGTWGYGLEVELPKVRYFSVQSPLAPGRLVYDISFEAVLDTSQEPATDVVCRLWNARPGY